MREWSKCLAEEVRPGNVVEANGHTVEVQHVHIENRVVHYAVRGEANLAVRQGQEVDVYR
jgi:hypothetical protein